MGAGGDSGADDGLAGADGAVILGGAVAGCDFEALDGEPADVSFLLVSPTNISGPHIKALARISRLLKNEDFKKRLTAASSPEELIGEISEEEKMNQPR